MTLIDKVLTQLEQETESATDPTTKSIGTYLLEMASKANSTLTELLLCEGKTLQSCVNYIQRECVKGLTKNFTERPKGGSAVVGMSAAQVYELALDYYRNDAKEVEFDLSKLISGIKSSQTASTATKTGSKVKKLVAEDAPDDMPNLFRLFADTSATADGDEAAVYDADDDEAQDAMLSGLQGLFGDGLPAACPLPTLDENGQEDEVVSNIVNLFSTPVTTTARATTSKVKQDSSQLLLL